MPDSRKGTEGLREDLARERPVVAGRSASYLRALDLLPSVLSGAALRHVEVAWTHRRFFAWYERPLLLLAALRNDVLAAGPSHPLWPGFAGDEPSADAVTEEALRTALDGSRHGVFDTLAHRTVQTNETSRAVAWLWPAALAGASNGGRAIALADVGASAGLNLVGDALSATWTDEDGAPLEVASRVRVVARLGLDRAPLDASRVDDARWLRACVWPGERHREERLLLAIEAFRAARVRPGAPGPSAPVLVPIGAAAVPARLDLLSAAEKGALVIAYQTVVRDYLEPGERREYEGGMRAWLSTHPPGGTLWVELEEAAGNGEMPAAIVAHVRTPRGELRSIELGRCGYHPTRVLRRRDAEMELTALLA